MKFNMLVVDPQNDFTLTDGALAVGGAIDSMDKVAQIITDNQKSLSDIFVTLDSHMDMHIAHPVMWKDGAGNNPAPYTLISNADVQNGVWNVAIPSLREWALYYTAELEKTGKYILCIWPPHCIIGSTGAAIYEPVLDAVRAWEVSKMSIATRLTKGSNFYTENYGVFAAEVPRDDDPKTQFDPSYLSLIENCDRLYVCGEASSHCVKTSVEQLIENCGEEHMGKLHVLKDCMDPVTGFENLQDDFFNLVELKGGKVITSDKMFD